MPFEKNNNYGKFTKRGPGKKRLVKDAMSNLEKAGINVFGLTSELINSMKITKDTSLQEKELLFKILHSMFKYDSLTKVESLEINNIKEEIEKIKTDSTIFTGTPEELLQSLKNTQEEEKWIIKKSKKLKK